MRQPREPKPQSRRDLRVSASQPGPSRWLLLAMHRSSQSHARMASTTARYEDEEEESSSVREDVAVRDKAYLEVSVCHFCDPFFSCEDIDMPVCCLRVCKLQDRVPHSDIHVHSRSLNRLYLQTPDLHCCNGVTKAHRCPCLFIENMRCVQQYSQHLHNVPTTNDDRVMLVLCSGEGHIKLDTRLL